MKTTTATTTTAPKAAKKAAVTITPDGNAWTFEPAAITLAGFAFPASYSVKPESGDVWVFATVQGMAVRLHIATGHALYHAAFEAAMAAKAAKQPAKPATPAEAAKQPETKAAKAAKQPAKPATPAKAAKQPETKAAKAAKQPEKPATPAKAAKQPEAKAAPAAKQPAKPATPAKAAKQPTAKAPAEAAKQPEPAGKSWIGTEITGRGWRIVFDDATQRTRVSFDGTPSAKQKAAVEAAGFYFSAQLKSWNKKLTHKAYRAAQALAATLTALK